MVVGRLAGGARALQHLDNVVVMTLARDLHWRPTIIVGLGLVLANCWAIQKMRGV